MRHVLLSIFNIFPYKESRKGVIATYDVEREILCGKFPSLLFKLIQKQVVIVFGNTNWVHYGNINE